MKLNASQLEAFYKIAQTLNFTKAAEQLYVTQSALSQRIAKLEEELETTLLIRDRGALRLTETGEQLLRYCQLQTQAESELLARFKNTREELAGSLRIGGFSSVNRSLVIPALRRILRDNPKLSLQLLSRELHELPGILRSAEVDYVLSCQITESESLENIFLGFEDSVLVQSKKHPSSEIYLDHDESDQTTKSYFLRSKLRFKPESRRFLDDVYGLIDGVRNGFGKAVLPLHLIEGMNDLEILHPQKKLSVPVYLTFFRQPYYRRFHGIFLETLQSHFVRSLRQK